MSSFMNQWMKIWVLCPGLVCSCIANQPVNQNDIQVIVSQTAASAQDKPGTVPELPGASQPVGSIQGTLTTEGFSTTSYLFQLLSDTLSGATVYLEHTNFRTQTDPSGFFTMNRVPVGNYTLIGEKTNTNGQKFKTMTSVTVQEGQTKDLKILSAKKTGSILGIAKLKDQTEHPGIDVYIEGSSFVARTEASGDFILINVPDGTYAITASRPGYKPASQNGLKVNSGGATIANPIQLEPDTQVTLTGDTVTTQGTGGIQGTVFDGSNQPLAGALVSFRGGGATLSDKDGKYLIGNIAPGVQTLLVNRPGFDLQMLEVEIKADKLAKQDLTLNSNVVVLSEIKGQVLDKDGNPVRLAAVLTEPNSTQGITDNNGRFSLTQVYPGDYLLVAVKASLGRTALSISLDRGQTGIEVSVQFTALIINKAAKP